MSLLELVLPSLLYALVILRHDEWPDLSATLRQRLRIACEHDQQLLCGSPMPPCASLINELHIPITAVTILDLLHANRRSVQIGAYRATHNVYIKRVQMRDEIRRILHETSIADHRRDRLLGHFVDNSMARVDGLQMRGSSAVRRFLGEFSVLNATTMRCDAVVAAVLLFENVELLLFAKLRPLGFAVPRLLAQAGLVFVLADEGKPLAEFNGRAWIDRVRIARNMLKAAMQFSEGVEGFRIYMTDASPDNIVVNEEANFAVTFVDLDSVIIVDVTDVTESTTHKHEIIPCDGCFAYNQEELFTYHQSDFNIYAICSILVSDLHSDSSKGLLTSTPEEIGSTLAEVLTECVLCSSNCKNRFQAAKYIIDTFDAMLL